jgi:hypothetical protein
VEGKADGPLENDAIMSSDKVAMLRIQTDAGMVHHAMSSKTAHSSAITFIKLPLSPSDGFYQVSPKNEPPLIDLRWTFSTGTLFQARYQYQNCIISVS